MNISKTHVFFLPQFHFCTLALSKEWCAVLGKSIQQQQGGKKFIIRQYRDILYCFIALTSRQFDNDY